MRRAEGKSLVFMAIVLLIYVIVIYSNHFDNSFQFDDIHVIVNNMYIKSLSNVPRFFYDITTSSTLPYNQIYRPILITSFAFDHWIGGGLQVEIFHITSFVLFLFQGVLMFFLYRRILEFTQFGDRASYYSIALVAVYLVHPVNAETVNYIFARSDLMSTFFVILSFLIFLKGGIWRRYFLYMIPLILGVLTKRTAIMFFPILYCYIVLFEIKYPIHKIPLALIQRKHLKWNIHFYILLAVSLVLFVIAHRLTTVPFKFFGPKSFYYLITQPYVLFHYVQMIFVPIGLSADTDLSKFTTLLSPKAIAGVMFMISYLIIMFNTSMKASFRPISFGMCWFLLALLPTSSVINLAETMNDHRMYFPYVGLVLSIGYTAMLLFTEIKRRYPMFKNNGLRKPILTFFLLLMFSFGYGTFQRCEVWDSQLSLWKDVTVKSPNNSRGWMNYGSELMMQKDLRGAGEAFDKAQELSPDYPLVYVNKAALHEAYEEYQMAEENFRKAVYMSSKTPTGYYHYALYLIRTGESKLAIWPLNRALELGLADINIRHQLMKLYSLNQSYDELRSLALETLKIDPLDFPSTTYLKEVEEISDVRAIEFPIDLNFVLTLGKYAYMSHDFYESVRLFEELSLRFPNVPEVHNYLCATYWAIDRTRLAEESCRLALKLNPNLSLANETMSQIQKTNQ